VQDPIKVKTNGMCFRSTGSCLGLKFSAAMAGSSSIETCLLQPVAPVRARRATISPIALQQLNPDPIDPNRSIFFNANFSSIANPIFS
jgi:hypothetical protein